MSVIISFPFFGRIGNAGSSVLKVGLETPWDFHSMVDYCPQPDPV